MPAKFPMDRWGPAGPAGAAARTFKNGQTFKHESDCPLQDNMVGACNCYVSRVRLIETPIGEVIATTEPDLREDMTYWKNRAKHWERQAWIARGLFLVMGIAGAVIVGWPGT